ncbi:hypothetical protein L249_0362 [Ophiocordyceps polyrhachis-furcata BCC 54312]|uniref:Elongator complex protein 1 n=1 Tax=Ophiocordyceps polyrhachis-furcata BCC 54312 TaxID=1330021 RepID=A0A367LFJ2_9HYPO|nr:hypothetical protein L249_0362 [Ophiocordyceps polyrhachis-furcata BCC 54312]
MKNLRNVRFVSQALGRSSPASVVACWDPDTDNVLSAVGPAAQHPKIELFRLSEEDSPRTVASWDAPSPSPDLPVDRVVSIHHIGGSAKTILVLEGGDFVTVQEGNASDGARIEIVGSIDAGIAAAAWSPDDELLAVVTKADTVIFMTSTFDPVVDVAITPDDLKASKHVSVGWGKKETQFQGRGAKALRDPTIPEKVDQGLPSPHEDGATTISWRGDGAYVAVNSPRQSDRRVVRIYSRQGHLESATEPVDGLEASLSWRPSGNLLAGIQRKADGVDVVFFEKNGLRHGEFPLRCSSAAAQIRLQWNADSTVLAVMCPDALQLWTMSNYHWYLKQEIPISNLSWLVWHPEAALRFAAVSDGAIILAETIFSTVRGTCRPPYDNGATAVIDGRAVKLTPFRAANVPPPMSLFDVETDSPAVDVAFGRRNESFAVLHGNGVEIYDMPIKSGRPAQPQLKSRVPFPDAVMADRLRPLRICCVANGSYRCIAYQDGLGCLHLGINAEAGRMNLLADKRDLVSTSTSDDDDSSLEGYGQDLAGNLYRLSESSSEPLPIRFHSHLPWFDVHKSETATVAYGLSKSGHLYANQRLLTKNCTSFLLSQDHLVFTTGNHLIKFVHLAPDVQDLEIPEDEPDKDERCRSVERGSRLIVAIPTNMSLVLQMPRGNVETIFPRAMVVSGIRSLIDEKNYARAFFYCRTQRVDMNILHDHRPEQFLASVAQFLDQVAEIPHVDLFLSSLREEDVTQTMYQDTKRPRPLPNPLAPRTDNKPLTGSKVNTVCDALLKRLQSRKTTNLQNILTAHMCKLPPALDDGLALVVELMQQDEKLAETAIEHVCFLVDVNRVYENALGLYNLDLALLVAQQSQRDPREYLPFIQNLHSLPKLRCRFEIDDHLGRRGKALKSLQALDTFDELCDYTRKHNLYQEALKLYRYEEARLRTLTRLFADYLESQSAYREAGLAFESLRDYKKATSCYRAAGTTCWQECLFTAQMQSPSLSSDAMADLSTSLADALWEAKDYSAAATIYLDHLSSIEGAVKCLCKGYMFAEAIRLVARRGRPELLETTVDVGLAEALGSTTEFLADCKSQLLAQVPRIVELRRKAAEDPLSFYEGDRHGGPGVPDDVSVAASSRLSTSASLFTRYTGKAGTVGTVGTGISRATSKNRRREEKKRARGRKGTVYEEEYLVNSVRRLVERLGPAASEVDRLVFALARRGMTERARAAEALMAAVVETCEGAVAEVFVSAEEASDEGEWKASSIGGDAVLHDWMIGRSKRLEPPVIATMGRLSLIG